MLSNTYVLATFRYDTAENEPAKNLQKSENNFATLIPQAPEWTEDAQSKPDKEALVRFEGKRKKPKGLAGIRLKDMASIPQEEPYSPLAATKLAKLAKLAFFCKILQSFGGLVLGCIKTNVCICKTVHFVSHSR